MPETAILTNEEVETAVQAIIRLYPQAGTDLQYETNFQLLCAVLLSAQTTDAAVNRVTSKLFKQFPTPQAMAAAPVAAIRTLIQSLGLSNNKANYLKQTATLLVDEFGGEVPASRKALMRLPGVGRKTANVVLTNAFNIPAFAVDTHVKRVSQRLHFVPAGASVQTIEQVMMQKLPKNLWFQAHHSMLLFGRHQCVARKHNHQKCLARIQKALPTTKVAQSALLKMAAGEV